MALDTLVSLAGGARALAQAEQLAMSDALSQLRCEDGGPRLTGRWQGNGASPYRISIELGRRPTRHACTCPSRQRPCKHVLALLARWSREPTAFERHGQLDAFASAPAPGNVAAQVHRNATPNGTDAERIACIRRHRERQVLGLQLSEQLVVRWLLDGLKRLDAMTLRDASDRLEELEGLHLPAVTAQLRALLHTAVTTDRDEAQEEAVAVQLGRAWTLIRRGFAWAAATGSDDLPGNGAWRNEAALQSALGRRWTPAELRLLKAERDLTLVELAWRRFEDPGPRARVEASLLYDLEGAGWMVERKLTPWSRLGQARPKASYPEPLRVRSAQCWPVQAGRPDAACPRVRWETGAAQSRPGSSRDWARLQEAAQPLAAIRARHVALRSTPWHERVIHPELLRVQSIEVAEGSMWLCDPDGAWQQLQGPPDALATLSCVGLPPEGRTAVVEVAEGPTIDAPTFELLALITPRGPVRLAG